MEAWGAALTLLAPDATTHEAFRAAGRSLWGHFHSQRVEMQPPTSLTFTRPAQLSPTATFYPSGDLQTTAAKVLCVSSPASSS